MRKKRILAVMISLILAFSITGCGKSNEESSAEESASSDVATSEKSTSNSQEAEKKENTENTIFQLGKKQTKEIKKILDNYGVSTAYNVEKDLKAQVHIAKDENDCSIKGAKGYNVSTTGTIKVNDGGDHGYEILYNAYENTDGSRYLYRITMDYPVAEEFKVDNFKMFKELIQGVHGQDYDFASLESWMKEQLTKKQSGEKLGGATREMGSYSEGLEGGDKKAGTESYSVTYTLSLKN